MMAAITDRVVQVSKMKIRRVLFWTKKSATAALVLILLGCEANHKNACPIDGQPPAWSGQRRAILASTFITVLLKRRRIHGGRIVQQVNE
jgi:hypothetical protein